MTFRAILFITILGCAHACGHAHAAQLIPACPKPAHHKHHTAPIASCIVPEPRTVLLQAPADDLTPIELAALTKYAIIEREVSAPCAAYPTVTNLWGYAPNIARTPELDPSNAAGALALLAGGICCIRGRR